MAFFGFYKREEGKLTIKLYSKEQFEKVGGMAVHNAKAAGLTGPVTTTAIDEVFAIVALLRAEQEELDARHTGR